MDLIKDIMAMAMAMANGKCFFLLSILNTPKSKKGNRIEFKYTSTMCSL